MSFYNPHPHRFYGCRDLHARTMCVGLLGQGASIIWHRKLPAQPGAF